MSEYTEGICGDGAAILKDGKPLAISGVLVALNCAEASRAENERLRKIISECCAAIGNGSFCAPSASIEFMEGTPKEIQLNNAAMIADNIKLRSALEKIDALQDGEFLNYDLAKKYARRGLEASR